MKQLLAKIALLAVSALLCFVFAEVVVRQLVDPVNFLRPRLLRDPVLRWRVEPHSAGHDAWGYRNPEVPESADIVTIGDSQTYGVGASATGSWPSWLSRLTGRSVYNLALAGYGPLDYRALAETRALELSPSIVVVGLYFGNDLMDAWRSAYTLDHWAFLRDPDWADDPARPPPPGSFEQVAEPATWGRGSRLAPLKQFMGEHSVLYRMAGLALSDLIYGYTVRQRAEEEDSNVDVVRYGGGEYLTGLNPGRRLREVDLDDVRIREGLRITLESLGAIHEACSKAGIDLVVVIIPTKISVFADFVREGHSPGFEETVRRLEQSERTAREETRAWLEEHGIPYVAVLDELRRRTADLRIYPRSDDGHPTSDGYRVVAERIAERIDTSGPVRVRTEAAESTDAGR